MSQCVAATNSGLQCTRSTQNGEPFCWQHGTLPVASSMEFEKLPRLVQIQILSILDPIEFARLCGTSRFFRALCRTLPEAEEIYLNRMKPFYPDYIKLRDPGEKWQRLHARAAEDARAGHLESLKQVLINNGLSIEKEDVKRFISAKGNVYKPSTKSLIISVPNEDSSALVLKTLQEWGREPEKPVGSYPDELQVRPIRVTVRYLISDPTAVDDEDEYEDEDEGPRPTSLELWLDKPFGGSNKFQLVCQS